MSSVTDVLSWLLDLCAPTAEGMSALGDLFDGDTPSAPGPRKAVASRPADAPEPAPPSADALPRARALLARHLATLLMEVARADGRVLAGENDRVLKLVGLRLNLTSAERVRLAQVLKELAQGSQSLEAAARACRQRLVPAERLLLLDGLYDVALADSEVVREERYAIRRIAELLGIDDTAQRSAMARRLGITAVCYEVLGIDPNATDEQVQEAYRRLTALRAPEAVTHLGSDALRLSAKRLAEIELAYQEIRRLRGSRA